jgi:hypothetical protein
VMSLITNLPCRKRLGVQRTNFDSLHRTKKVEKTRKTYYVLMVKLAKLVF